MYQHLTKAKLIERLIAAQKHCEHTTEWRVYQSECASRMDTVMNNLFKTIEQRDEYIKLLETKLTNLAA